MFSFVVVVVVFFSLATVFLRNICPVNLLSSYLYKKCPPAKVTFAQGQAPVETTGQHLLGS